MGADASRSGERKSLTYFTRSRSSNMLKSDCEVQFESEKHTVLLTCTVEQFIT